MYRVKIHFPEYKYFTNEYYTNTKNKKIQYCVPTDLRFFKYSDLLIKAAPRCRIPEIPSNLSEADITSYRVNPDESFSDLVTLPDLPRIHFSADPHPTTEGFLGGDYYRELERDTSFNYCPVLGRNSHTLPDLGIIFGYICRFTDDGLDREVARPIDIKLRLIEHHLKSSNKKFIEETFLCVVSALPVNVDQCIYTVNHMYLLAVQEEACTNPLVNRSFVYNLGVGQYKLDLIEKILMDYLSGDPKMPSVIEALSPLPTEKAGYLEQRTTFYVVEHDLRERLKLPIYHPPPRTRAECMMTDAQILKVAELVEADLRKDNALGLFKYLATWRPWGRCHEPDIPSDMVHMDKWPLLEAAARHCLIEYRINHLKLGKIRADDLFLVHHNHNPRLRNPVATPFK